MGKKSSTVKAKQASRVVAASNKLSKQKLHKQENVRAWFFLILIVTAVCYLPVLQNNFTNWDDEFYVINNTSLKGPDWKVLLTEPLLGNYHPLTMITLALNYQISGIDPFSYMLLNLLLHLANTALVFYFIYALSGKQLWASFFTALIFGIHPMHVESVAWIAERKDVLYTFFFLLSLLKYWHYVQNRKKLNYALSFLFFGLSLLSKPAAVILPFVLFLIDYWAGRKISFKNSLDKIPFFLGAVAIGVVTMQIQSGVGATMTSSVYPIWARLLFACYVVLIYFFRFFIPYPLATLHPFPAADNLGSLIYASPLFIIALLVFLWRYRKNKVIIFGFGFFIVNLLLVLQIISIGSSIVSERYTYVPYIGLAFTVAMLLSAYKPQKVKQNIMALSFICAFIFGIISFNQAKVWENSGSLWTQVIQYYPDNQLARAQRANYLSKIALSPEHKEDAAVIYQQAFEDCKVALESKPDYETVYKTRALMNLDLKHYKDALADADSLIKYAPKDKYAYYIRGSAFSNLGENGKAIADFSKSITMDTSFHKAYNNRSALLMNYLKNYDAALKDLNKAIQLSPEGSYYLNRSICYYKMNDMTRAKADALIALEKGATIQPKYRQILKL